MRQNDNFTRNVVVKDNIGFNQRIEWAQSQMLYDVYKNVEQKFTSWKLEIDLHIFKRQPKVSYEMKKQAKFLTNIEILDKDQSQKIKVIVTGKDPERGRGVKAILSMCWWN